MYVITKGDKPFDEVMGAAALRGYVDDIDAIMKKNELAKAIMEEKDSGRPGHYYGRDMVIEGVVPLAVGLMAAREFADDPLWYTDDVKFQDFMKRHPEYNWLRR